MAINLKPRNDRVIVKPDEEEEQSAGGIVLAPSASKDKPQQGTVLAVGCGKINDAGNLVPVGIETGSKVLFGKYSGTEVKISGDTVLVLREDDIMAIVE
tara:strand:+ start:321 stop:617 length:297 start_codon:yes stop_codon:yes gene_type:complete